MKVSIEKQKRIKENKHYKKLVLKHALQEMLSVEKRFTVELI